MHIYKIPFITTVSGFKTKQAVLIVPLLLQDGENMYSVHASSMHKFGMW